jgi:hypothetical protein
VALRMAELRWPYAAANIFFDSMLELVDEQVRLLLGLALRFGCRSVMSPATFDAPVIFPWPPLPGETVSKTSIKLPSLLRTASKDSGYDESFERAQVCPLKGPRKNIPAPEEAFDW